MKIYAAFTAAFASFFALTISLAYYGDPALFAAYGGGIVGGVGVAFLGLHAFYALREQIRISVLDEVRGEASLTSLLNPWLEERRKTQLQRISETSSPTEAAA